MKKGFIVVLVIAIIGLTITGYSLPAEQTDVFVYNYQTDDVEINIHHSDLSQEQLDRIIANFTSTLLDSQIKQDQITPMFNLLCVFGHSIQSSYLEVTRHNVNTTTPKCITDTYIYKICTRSGCDYSTYEFQGSYVSFCH